jgi:hypothetical protein
MPTYYYSTGKGQPFVRIPMKKPLDLDDTLTKKGYAADAAAVGEALKNGGGGEDGFSPIANVTQTEDGAVISVTDKTGTTTATVTNGKDGDAGDPGKSAYQYAQEGGYTGTEQEFMEKLASASDYPIPCVTDYGAKGDGVADDTEAFRNALKNARVLLVPGGTYNLSAGLAIGDNCCVELSQDTVLNFTQTTGNCITLGMLSALKGNHATIKVPYAFSGHVLHAYSNDHTSAEQQNVPPWSKWDPQWKSGRYVSDVNICKEDYRGFHYAVNPDECKGAAVYISADSTAGTLTYMWGVRYSGLRIAGAFAYGIHAQNFDGGWLHEMRIDAFIDACETGVCLEDCSQTYISAIIQPRRAYTEAKEYVPYAKNGIKLVRSKNTDLSGSRVWDWNGTHTLWTQHNEYQHVAMYGDCSGTILNDYTYHSQGDTRKRIYTDNDYNLETVTIIQEPIDRWFKLIDGEPYYSDGIANRRLLDEGALDTLLTVDWVKDFADVLETATDENGDVFNDIGYQIGKRFTSLGTGTTLTDSVYYMTTGFIQIPLGSTIYGKSLNFDDTAKTYAGIVYYNDKRERVANIGIGNIVKGSQYYADNYTRTSDGFSVRIPASVTLKNMNVTYIRVVFPMTCVGENPMMSIDEPIEYTVEGFLADGVKVKGENVIGTPGQITPDWVATKKLEGGDVIYIPQQTLTGGVWQNLQMSLQPGFVYDVTLNGEVYACEASENGRGAILGNNSSLTLNDYPFCIMWAGGTATSGMFFKDSSISSPVTLKVTDHADYVYDKMPEGYLPDSVVKSVNGAKPDADGNVEVEGGGEYLVPMEVPASPAVGELWYDPDAEAPGGGITEETDPTVQGWAKTSIPAAVGQYFKVSAVDENGNVTAVEAVDAPSGGGETWRLVNSVKLTEDAASIDFTKDSEGNDFALRRVHCGAIVYGGTANTAAGSLYVSTTSNRRGQNTHIGYASQSVPVSGGKRLFSVTGELMGNKLRTFFGAQADSGSELNIQGFVGVPDSGLTLTSWEFDSIRDIHFTSNGKEYGVGTIIEVWGVDV